MTSKPWKILESHYLHKHVHVSPNPANHTNLIYYFLALNAEKLGNQRLDETEEIEVLLKPLDEVIAMAKKVNCFNPCRSVQCFSLWHIWIGSSENVTHSMECL